VHVWASGYAQRDEGSEELGLSTGAWAIQWPGGETASGIVHGWPFFRSLRSRRPQLNASHTAAVQALNRALLLVDGYDNVCLWVRNDQRLSNALDHPSSRGALGAEREALRAAWQLNPAIGVASDNNPTLVQLEAAAEKVTRQRLAVRELALTEQEAVSADLHPEALPDNPADERAAKAEAERARRAAFKVRSAARAAKFVAAAKAKKIRNTA
jgi:hypothetical protein